MRSRIAATLFFLHLLAAAAPAQQTFPYCEHFDTARAPSLPAGWLTTKSRLPSGDFTTSSSTPFSAPLAAVSTDARVAQCLVSPAISFAGRTGDSLVFYERRSSSFTAGMIVDATVREDSSSWIPVSDTLRLSASSAYIRRAFPLPPFVSGQPSVKFRWRTLGNGTGATGTLRIDDVTISVLHAADLALDPVILVPSLITAGDDVPCTVTLRNAAHAGEYMPTLSLIDSTQGRRIADSTIARYFAEGDSLAIMLAYPRIDAGIHRLVCALSLASDEDASNDLAAVSLTVRTPARALVINEIMYEPIAGRTEYVELYNRSFAAVDLYGWNMGDASGTTANRVTIPLPRSTRIVGAHAMCVVAKDSSILEWITANAPQPPILIVAPSLSLNNAGDDVLLFDAGGATIDSVSYIPAWHLPKVTTTGRSLERINPELPGTDPRNWSTSVAVRGGTPGAQNSIFTTSVPADATLSFFPNPFSPNNDGIEDFLGITYTLPSAAVDLRVRIYDTTGRLVRTLANNEPAASTGTILWNGRDDANTRVRMGMYIVLVEALDPRGGVLRTMKGVAVVATRLE